MLRGKIWSAQAAALVAAVVLGAAGQGDAAPPAGFRSVPPIPFTPPTTHYVTPPPAYHPTPQPSYYQSHYNNGVYPHASYYSYYDNPPPPQRAPASGTAQNLTGAGVSSLVGPLYPDEYGYFGPGTGPALADVARITVQVPADAEVLFDGHKTRAKGAVRQFETPPLAPGKPFHYEVVARWKKNGRQVTQREAIPVSAGSRVRLDFPLPSGTKDEGGAKKK
jgi:uncharacterized protein (TIGR03000 family)